MLRKLISTLIFFYLLITILNFSYFNEISFAIKGNNLYVGGTDFGNYTKIQDAIDNSSNNDTIYVFGKIYNENIVINKSINLVGSDKNSTIIRGNNSLYIIFIKSSWVNITGFTIKSGKMGIYASGTNYSFNNISDNIFEESKNNLIKNNKFSDDNKAIVLNRWADNNLIFNNNLTDNFIGISLYSSFKNQIDKNHISNCTNGVYLSYSTNNTIAKNTIDSSHKNGIYLTNSDPNEYSLNYFSNNYQDVKTGPEPPKIKAPGFDLIIIVFSLFFILLFRKIIK
ncbi:hypothetical protein AYK20_08935 [Thermoplasmatales archaeon SG8-52-1]|nr:MAG: hypothetical protein AYK20_08935 [Thermoplasmatales archaeon SG8-52-1]